MAYAKINSVTNANMAKVNNAAKAALGKIASIDAPSSFADGYSIALDGTNQYFTTSDSTLSGDLGSVSMWFKLDTTAYSRTIFNFHADHNNNLLIYYHGGRNETNAEHKGGGTERAISVTPTVENNGWHHLAYTWDTSSDASVLYIDGSSVGTGQAADFTGAVVNINFGYRQDSGLYFIGNLNDASLYDDVLTGGEVSTIYNSGAPKDESSHSGLVGYWKLEQNTDDSSGEGNSATLTNTPSYDSDTP